MRASARIFEILIQGRERQISSAALDRRYFYPFVDLTRLVFGVARRPVDPRVPAARQQTVVRRLEKYAGLARGYRPIAELARERTLERIKADERLLGPYVGEVQQAIGDAGAARWHPRPARRQRRQGVEEELRRARAPAAGLQRLAQERHPAAGARRSSAAAQRVLPTTCTSTVSISPPEALIARALTSFAEIRNQMSITAGLIARERALPDADYRAVIRELKKQQVPAAEVMPLYRQRLGAIESIVREQRIVTLPDRAASIRLATEAENAQQPAPHMSPPRLLGNTGEYGEFVLTTGVAATADTKALRFDDFSHEAGTWSLTAHEARPGHELQFAKMIEAGVSTARAVFAFNSVNVEGWALYAEAEMQPYEPLDGQLFALQARGMRAARAFLNPMVNLGQLEPEHARRFLVDEVGLSEGITSRKCSAMCSAPRARRPPISMATSA